MQRRRNVCRFTSYVCQRTRRRRRARPVPPKRQREGGRPRWSSGDFRGHASPARSPARHIVRSLDWRSADERHRFDEGGADHQRIDPRPAAAMARRRHGDVARRQSTRRGHVDPLARHHPAGEHGRRAWTELSRHPPARVGTPIASTSSNRAPTGITVIRGSRSSAASTARSSSIRANPIPSRPIAST